MFPRGKRFRGAPGAGQWTPLPIFGKPQSEPGLRVSIHQDAGEIPLDANEFIAESVAAVNVSKQPLELIARNRPLIFLERLPLRRVGQRIAEMIDRQRRRVAEEEEEGEEEEGGMEDPGVKMMRDHGLDFRLFNTMLAGC